MKKNLAAGELRQRFAPAIKRNHVESFGDRFETM